VGTGGTPSHDRHLTAGGDQGLTNKGPDEPGTADDDGLHRGPLNRCARRQIRLARLRKGPAVWRSS
jgi:hypothetical protein